MKKQGLLHLTLLLTLLLTVVIAVVFLIPSPISYTQTPPSPEGVLANGSMVLPENNLPPLLKETPATHIPVPSEVKALYVTGWVSGIPKLRDPIINIVDTTEANALVIDIKDYSGHLSFKAQNPALQTAGLAENRIPHIRDFINELHAKNIYVIGRIAVFQDSFFIKQNPDVAVLTKSTKEVWKDRKGISWVDPGAQKYWEYISTIGKEAYAQGFDELNFDYIRFPSDGNMKDIYYPASLDTPKADVINSFFQYLHTTFTGTGVRISADLFGLTTTETTDMGIGQVLEHALVNFDYVAPMVYPSHYAAGTYGYKNPATKPYEIVFYSMKKAVERAQAIGVDPQKLRPWIQDFNLGATYTDEMVRLEIKGVYDAGLSSFMIWDPANKYHEGALERTTTDTQQIN